jgi:acyl carrier protein
MGLDVVELVMRTEEVFDITIPDEDAERASTVGKLYEIICARLSLPPSPIRPTSTAAPRSLHPTFNPSTIPWTHEEVWSTLVAIVIEQLQVDEEDIHYDARWNEDLRAD